MQTYTDIQDCILSRIDLSFDMCVGLFWYVCRSLLICVEGPPATSQWVTSTHTIWFDTHSLICVWVAYRDIEDCLHLQTCTHMSSLWVYVHIRVYVHVCMCIYVYIYVYIHVYTDIHRHAYTHTPRHIQTYTHTHQERSQQHQALQPQVRKSGVCVCVCVCVMCVCV